MPAAKKIKATLDVFIVFFTSLFVYLLTLYPTVGTEDSGELITAAATLDIAHPPGYPVHTLLGKLFTIIIPFGNIGWRVNLMSAFFASLTVLLLFLVAKKITKNSAIAMIAGLLFAFSDIFWSQAIRTETYTLHAFFLMLVIYLLTLWDESQKNTLLYAGALTIGLGLGNQHLMFLAGIPIIAYVLIRNRQTVFKPFVIAASIASLLLGLSVYAYLPLRTASGPYENPSYIKHEGLHDWNSFFFFVNRGIYGGTVSAGNEEDREEDTSNALGGTLKFFIDLTVNNIQGLIPFSAKLFEQSLYIGLLLFFPGLVYLYRNRRTLFWLIALLLIFYSIVQLTFIGYSPDMHPYTLHSSRPFFISALLIIAITFAAGLQWFMGKIKSRTQQKKALSFLIFLPLIPLLVNFSANNESGNYIAYDINRHLLESLPPNAHFITTGRDNFTFPLYYLRKVENLRPDVNLEVYYVRKSLTQNDFENKSAENAENNGGPIFIDLLPHDYDAIDLRPYNFVYQFGRDETLPSGDRTEFPVRGIRLKMDYPNNKLTGLYYLKMAVIHRENEALLQEYFSRVKTELPYFEQFDQFINDYLGGSFSTGMF